MKYNKFSAGKASGEQGWNPAVTGRDGEYRITARGKNYRIERRIIPGKAGIRVLDKITNTSAEDQGFHIATISSSRNSFLAKRSVWRG